MRDLAIRLSCEGGPGDLQKNSSKMLRVVLAAAVVAAGAAAVAPEQVRLALTLDTSVMNVFWATNNVSTPADYAGVVQWGEMFLDANATAETTSYTIFGYQSSRLHNAAMTGLRESTIYQYRVGSERDGWSPAFNFTTAPPAGTGSYPVKFIAYGDMGVLHSQNTATLTSQMLRSGDASFIVHAGEEDRVACAAVVGKSVACVPRVLSPPPCAHPTRHTPNSPPSASPPLPPHTHARTPTRHPRRHLVRGRPPGRDLRVGARCVLQRGAGVERVRSLHAVQRQPVRSGRGGVDEVVVGRVAAVVAAVAVAVVAVAVGCKKRRWQRWPWWWWPGRRQWPLRW